VALSNEGSWPERAPKWALAPLSGGCSCRRRSGAAAALLERSVARLRAASFMPDLEREAFVKRRCT
jgi:hypothetical protein